MRTGSDGSYRGSGHDAIPRRERQRNDHGFGSGPQPSIDDRKRAEEELARNKAILQAAIESLPFEFFAIGSDGRYILQNAILREHYGEAIGNRPEDYAPDDTLASCGSTTIGGRLPGNEWRGRLRLTSVTRLAITTTSSHRFRMTARSVVSSA